jgi:hypothetical protein
MSFERGSIGLSMTIGKDRLLQFCVEKGLNMPPFSCTYAPRLVAKHPNPF